MPRIFVLHLRVGRADGFIYPKDHKPAHVHIICRSEQAELKITMKGEVLFNRGFSGADVDVVKEYLVEFYHELMEAWDEYQG